MSIILNREAAIVGFLNAAAIEIMRLNKQDNQKYTLNDMTFSVLDIIHYSNMLRYADCGPIVKDFDEKSLISLIGSHDDLFELSGENDFTLRPYINTSGELLEILIRELRPRFSYPAKFLRFMMLFD